MSDGTLLFLDDMESRFNAFYDRCKRHETGEGVGIHWAKTADEAIELLKAQKFDQIFLDHDLSEEDIMCEPGKSRTGMKTGMDVVDWLVENRVTCEQIFVHTCNTPAATEMCRRLHSAIGPDGEGRYAARKIPFPQLLNMIV